MAVTVSKTYLMPSDKISEFTEGGYPVGDRAIGSDMLAKIRSKVYRSGIFPQDSSYYLVSAADGLTVKVSPGYAMLNGRDTHTPDEHILEIEEVTKARTDRVVLRLDLNNEVRDVVLSVKTDSTELVRNDTVWELGLADINLSENATQVQQSNITDLRLDSEACGLTTVEFTDIDTTELFNQIKAIIEEQEEEWKAQLQEWADYSEKQQEIWEEQTQKQETEFVELKTEIEVWWAALKIDIDKGLLSFNFDNIARMQGSTRDTEFLESGDIKETIFITGSKKIVATREATFNHDGSISTIEKVYDEDGETIQEQANIEVLFAEDGNISEVVK